MQPAEDRHRLFPKGSMASSWNRDSQDGLRIFTVLLSPTRKISFSSSNIEGNFSNQEPPPKQEGHCGKDSLRGTESSELPLWPDTALRCSSTVHRSNRKQERTHGNSTANFEITLTLWGLVRRNPYLVHDAACILQEMVWFLTKGSSAEQLSAHCRKRPRRNPCCHTCS